MKKYKNTSPVFTEEIDIMENSDPVNADEVTTVPIKQLADNTRYNNSLIARMASRLQKLEDLVRRLFAFSYDDDSETIVAGDNETEYADETITIPDDLAEYSEDDETITLSGGSMGGGGGVYILPTATATRLGGVRIGENVNVKTDGTISIDTEQSAEAAAEIIEATAYTPTDEEIDSLWN